MTKYTLKCNLDEVTQSCHPLGSILCRSLLASALFLASCLFLSTTFLEAEVALPDADAETRPRPLLHQESYRV